MQKTQQDMLRILSELQEDYGVIAVKAEFEAEGSRTDELVMLNEVVFRANARLIIKIGGCEAVRDLDQCRLLGASGIMAPMIETPFALSKYKSAARKVYGDEVDDIEWIINAETKTCLSNFDDILGEASGFINTVIVGRSDLSASMGVARSNINGEEVYNAARTFLEKSKAAGLTAGFGGSLLYDSVPFIERMRDTADRIETRKIVFDLHKPSKGIGEGIIKALEFELLYLQHKCAFYNRMAGEDISRVTNLSGKVALFKEQLGID